MTDADLFLDLSPTTLADELSREHIMDIGIRPLWAEMPRVAGAAYTVKCAPGDNLMLHAAIYRAAPGSIIVVEAGSMEAAVAGGNVCAVAQKRGIAAFIVDGVIRDVGEIRHMAFPVFARGVFPKPGTKERLGTLNEPVVCGGVHVGAGDIIVADDEGIVVVPLVQAEAVLLRAEARAAKEAEESLARWELAHRARIEAALKEKGFTAP
jgi:regulator of RNase E activity RraA